MQGQFAIVVWVVGVLGIIAAFLALVGTGKTWSEYGKGRLVMDHDLVSTGPAAGSTAALRERDIEIREMLEAQNARRARRGEPLLDVEAEFVRLTATTIDAGLRAEIRDLVMARNARRARLGKAPLDVETEIAREIAGLQDLGV